MKIIKKCATGIVSVLLASAGLLQVAGATPSETVVTGFSFSESAIHDPYNNRYIVSNSANAPGAPAVAGYISTVTPSGQVTNYKWIDGTNPNTPLNDPLGMAIYGGKLYVADIDYLRVFNLFTGQSVANIHIPGVTGLNDVAAYWGGVFVSDPGVDFATNTPTGTDAVYKVDGITNQVTTVASGTQLANPNGLYYDAVQGLLVNPMTSHTVYKLNIANGTKTDFVTLPDLGYDGIAKTGGSFYFNNPPTGNIYKVNALGTSYSFLANYPNFPADINADASRNRLLIPELLGGQVVIKQL